MVEKADRRKVEHDAQDGSPSEWEVFCRDEPSDPLRHVGSVVADDADEAHDHASRLFGWYATDIWVCPAESVTRFSARADESEGGEGDDAGAAEPRVYEETEGTPHVSDS